MPTDFKHSKILIVGDIMLDRYWSGNTARISPEAPVPVVAIKDTEVRIGGAGNVALNVNALHAKAKLLGIAGRDHDGAQLTEILEKDGIDHQLNLTENQPTITKLRVLSQRQQMIRLDFEEDYSHLDKSGLIDHYRQQLADADLVILSDYAKGTLSDPQTLIKLAKAQNIPVIIDPKGNDFSRYHGATMIKPNLKEFELIVGACQNDTELEEKAKQLIRDCDLEYLLVTRGDQGMVLIHHTGEVAYAKATSKELADVTGAGDTVIATLAAALATGYSAVAAMHLSNLAAGIVVKKLGTSTVSNEELTQAYLKTKTLPKGICNREDLAQAVADSQQQGRTVVMTNGCFDIVHAGHVEYLQKAKALGDRLIVALNSDESIQRLKGPERPVAPLESRLKVIAALDAVDWVVPFEEDTPEALLALVKPDLLVKGGDYTKDEIVGKEIVEGYGGKVQPIQHDFGHISTTKLLNKSKRS